MAEHQSGGGCIEAEDDDACLEFEGEVRIVARYGEDVLRRRDELRTEGLRRDLASLKITLEYVSDEVNRLSDTAEEAAILLLKQRVAELEEHWRRMTPALAARCLAQTPAAEHGGSGLASVRTIA